jgi:hypothetical protein
MHVGSAPMYLLREPEAANAIASGNTR